MKLSWAVFVFCFGCRIGVGEVGFIVIVREDYGGRGRKVPIL